MHGSDAGVLALSALGWDASVTLALLQQHQGSRAQHAGAARTPVALHGCQIWLNGPGYLPWLARKTQ